MIRGKWSQEGDKLVGRIVERYGCVKEEAERQIDAWVSGREETDDRAHR